MIILAIMFVISCALTLVSVVAVVRCSPRSQFPGSPAVIGSFSKAFFVRACIGLAFTSAGTLLIGYALVTA